MATGTSEKTRIAITDAEKYYYAATVLDYTITRYQAYSTACVANGLGFEIQTPFSSIDKDNNVMVSSTQAWNHPSYGAVYVIGNADGDAPRWFWCFVLLVLGDRRNWRGDLWLCIISYLIPVLSNI